MSFGLTDMNVHEKMTLLSGVQRKIDEIMQDLRKLSRDSDIDLVEEICNFFNIPPDRLQSSSRKEELVDARKIIAYEMKNQQYTYAEITKKLNRKDHTSAINWCKKYQDHYATDEKFRHKADAFRGYINQLLQKIQSDTYDGTGQSGDT